jgi:hypothetical protein
MKSVDGNLMRAIDALAARRGISVLVIGLLAFAGSVMIGLIGGIAGPKVHDEFSYLLAADTFARGRLTNPTHPLWIHFESIHIIHLPTYMSKFPPAQGAILALGQLLTGYPLAGVWLSMGLMCAAICWMLYAWVSPRWALIGGLFSAVHPIVGLGGYWAQSYWGGALAATGAALVLGGVRYALKDPSIHRSILTGVGLAVLANTRPYEGLLVSICAGSMLLAGLMRVSDLNYNPVRRKIILPLVLTGTVTLAWMGFYNFRLTGNMFRLPYQVHEATYGVAPLFVWQKPVSTPTYRHIRLREFHTITELTFYAEKRSLAGFVKVNADAFLLYGFFVGNILTIPLLINFRALARWTLRNRYAQAAVLTYAVVTIGLMIETYSHIHYWAPVVPFNYYFTVQAIRLWRWRDRRIRPFIVPIMLCLVVMLLAIMVRKGIREESNPLSAHVQRANLMAKLKQQAGRHVVLVGYGPGQSEHGEWVYNLADIDSAKIVWAHDMGKNENCKLVDYFKDHAIWSLEIERDDSPVKVTAFPRHSCQ